MTQPTDEHGIGDDHYISALGVRIWVDGELTRGSAEIEPALWGTGTERVRTGHLATMVDMVGGHPPGGPVNPTIDLRVRVLEPPPRTGSVELTGRVLRAGRRLLLSETLLYPAGADRPFARGITTFINHRLDVTASDGTLRPRAPLPRSLDDLIAARPIDDRTIEVAPDDRLSNGHAGTMQGGAQATVAEIAAEHALGRDGPVTVTDLDIRYLSRLEVGPLHATAEPLGPTGPLTPVVVELTDSGRGGKLVATVTLVVERC